MGAILTIDTGSSSMKGCLLTPQGQEAARTARNYSMYRGGSECVEMDAAVFHGALLSTLAELSAEAARLSLSLDALALTSQRSSVLALDEQGRPLRPILMWHDKRSTAICEALNREAGAIYGLCGMRASPVFSAPKMRWLKEHEPGIYHRAAKLLGIHEYLLFLLTGEFVTDASLASRTNLLDLRRLEWSPELLRRFGLDVEKLCAIRPAGSIVGRCVGSAAAQAGLPASVPVISAGGDQQCAALGLGVMRQGDVAVNTGSGSFVTAALEHPVFDPEMRVVCNVASVPGQWVLEAGALSAGLAWQWCCDTFFEDDYQRAEAAAASSAPGANGVVMLPCLGGKGAPQWNPHARGAFAGLNFSTGLNDLARACLEGIAAELADCLGAVRAAGGLPSFSGIHCAGGLLQSSLFGQILCDACGLPLHCFSSLESTTRGLWMSAVVALGVLPGYAEAFALSVREENARSFTPDAFAHKVYTAARQERQALYDAAAGHRGRPGKEG